MFHRQNSRVWVAPFSGLLSGVYPSTRLSLTDQFSSFCLRMDRPVGERHRRFCMNLCDILSSPYFSSFLSSIGTRVVHGSHRLSRTPTRCHCLHYGFSSLIRPHDSTSETVFFCQKRPFYFPLLVPSSCLSLHIKLRNHGFP